MESPRLKAHFHVEVVDGSRVFLYAEGMDYLVPGKAAAAVLPYLDGRRTVSEIVQELSGSVPFTTVLTTLRRYQAAGHLAEGRPDLPERVLAYWDALGIDPAAVTKGTPVTVSAAEGVDATPVVDALTELGLKVGTGAIGEVPAEGVSVVLVDDYLDPALEGRNALQLASGLPWLLAKPGGVSPWLGPYLDPDHTGCWSCLSQRLSGNRQLERYLAGKRGERTPLHAVRAQITAGPLALAGMLAAEVARIVATGEPGALCGQMVALDLATLETSRHVLVRQPQCPSCGTPPDDDPKIVLTPRQANHVTDGGYRVNQPQETFERLERHISPHLGAITKLISIGADSTGLTFSYAAGHNFAMVNDSMDLLRRNLRGQSGGKGRSEIQAKVSAVCEAIERYSGVWRGDEPVIRAAYADLDPATAVHPDRTAALLRRAARRAHGVERRPGAPAAAGARPVPGGRAVRLVAGLVADPGRGAARPGRLRLVRPPRPLRATSSASPTPTAAPRATPWRRPSCRASASWSSATRWRCGGTTGCPAPASTSTRWTTPTWASCAAFYAGMDRDLWMLDLTTDLGIPVFAAVSRRRHAVEDVMVGFGAHPDPRIAAFRALTELNQFLPSVRTA